MQTRHANIFAAVTLGLASCGLHAQTSIDPPGTPAAAADPMHAQPSAPATRPTESNAITLSNSNPNGVNPVFARLDIDHKGYLSPRDVVSNQFLSDNFRQCDTNGDGRLSTAETTDCLKASGQR